MKATHIAGLFLISLSLSCSQSDPEDVLGRQGDEGILRLPLDVKIFENSVMGPGPELFLRSLRRCLGR